MPMKVPKNATFKKHGIGKITFTYGQKRRESQPRNI